MKHLHGRWPHPHNHGERTRVQPTHDHSHDEKFWLPEFTAASGPRGVPYEYYFVPGQLLIPERDLGRPGVREVLKEYGFAPVKGYDLSPEECRRKGIAPDECGAAPNLPGMTFLSMKSDDPAFRIEIPKILDVLRARSAELEPEAPALSVTPNHVLLGSSHAMWGPGKAVEPAASPAFSTLPDNGVGKDVKLAILDTGVVQHTQFPAGVPCPTAEFDEPDEDANQVLDYEAGHGTFITGVALRYAPCAEVVNLKVLTANGRVSDTSLANRLWQCGDADIINLSLGGYTYDNRGLCAVPLVLEMLRRKNPDLVVVAAAGNDHSSRPFFPAAMKHVIGVAAVDENDKRHEFSNFGWWVDARARGDFVSTFYDKRQGGVLRNHDTGTTFTFDGWASWAGTSFAAPVVAAAIAARIDKSKGIGARQAAQQLLEEAGDTWRQDEGVLIAPKDFSQP